MSFSAQIKHEVARNIPERGCCQRAELAALSRMIGNARIRPLPGSLLLATKSPAVARAIFKLAKQLGWQTAISVRYHTRPRHYRLFVIDIPLEQGDLLILLELGLVDKKNVLKERVDSQVVDRICCRRAFLQGCFLGSGFVSRPDHFYHLEFVLDNAETAGEVGAILEQFGLVSGLRERKGGYGIYLKDADQIGEFLRIIGASRGVLEFENSRIMKEMRNKVNRLVNCETANLKKSVEAGLRQAAIIKEIDSCIGLMSLSPNLRQLADLRLLYPEASLAELGRLLSPPIGKSGVNHRMRELQRIAGRHKEK